MKKSILVLIIAIMLFCVACVSKDAGNVQDETENLKDVNDTFCDTTYDYVADGFTNLARYVETKNGGNLFVFDINEPIVAYPDDNENKEIMQKVIDDLTSGDLVAIKCDRVKETYPGQTELYDIKKLEDGEIDDIPSNTLERLRDLGWIE